MGITGRKTDLVTAWDPPTQNSWWGGGRRRGFDPSPATRTAGWFGPLHPPPMPDAPRAVRKQVAAADLAGDGVVARPGACHPRAADGVPLALDWLPTPAFRGLPGGQHTKKISNK